MEVLFVAFAFISTSVLGLLCLLVLEYQNSRSRRWNRLWLDRNPGAGERTSVIPPPVSPDPAVYRSTQETFPFVLKHNTLDASRTLS